MFYVSGGASSSGKCFGLKCSTTLRVLTTHVVLSLGVVPGPQFTGSSVDMGCIYESYMRIFLAPLLAPVDVPAVSAGSNRRRLVSCSV